MVPWKRLIRFEAAEDSRVHYGEPETSDDIGELYHRGKTIKAKVLEGNDPFSTSAKLTSRTLTVKTLLAPLESSSIPTIRALGGQYSTGDGFKPTPIPILFYKPKATLSSPEAPIPIPRAAHGKFVDHEVELLVILGKTGRDISEADAMSYVAAYTVCNDVTSRKRCVEGIQWGLGKSFDGWLPIGPCLVSAAALGDISKLKMTTHVNERLAQQASLADLVYSLPRTLAELSSGTTLEAGSVICMGTPPPLGRTKEVDHWLKDGDVCRCSISGVGTLYNPVKGQARAKL